MGNKKAKSKKRQQKAKNMNGQKKAKIKKGNIASQYSDIRQHRAMQVI